MYLSYVWAFVPSGSDKRKNTSVSATKGDANGQRRKISLLDLLENPYLSTKLASHPVKNMILSHKHKFIFIKTNKTAGTSVEIALAKHCGPDDIITPIGADDEEIKRELGYPGPQNYTGTVNRGLIGGLLYKFSKKQKEKFYNHMPAREIKARIDDEIWRDYYKFCVERNPWDRVVSLYYWRTRDKKSPPSIPEYVASKAPNSLKRKGIGLYTIDGNVVVDKVCLFENLTKDLEEVRQIVGIPEPLELPRAKSKFRPAQKSYHEALGEKEKERIAKLFSDEIKLFGYTFDK